MKEETPQWSTEVFLAARPTKGIVPDEHFGVRRVSVPPASSLRPDEVIVQIFWASADPAMRGWISPSKRSYVPPVPLNAVMRAFCVGRTLTSASGVPRGALVSGSLGWRTVCVARVRSLTVAPALPAGVPASALLGVLGGTGLTAYFGLLRVGAPKRGDVVVVSAAAGATGGVVVQIAKRVLGCRVVGIAGGEAKCEYVRDALGADACLDYRAGDLKRRLREAVGEKGADVYFDNVGGQVLEAALAVIRDGARVVLCGAISAYNNPGAPGPRNYVALIARRARMQGFIVTDFKEEFAEATRELAGWVGEGKIGVRQDVVEGIENAPKALVRLFEGRNIGKVVIRVHPDENSFSSSVDGIRISKL